MLRLSRLLNLHDKLLAADLSRDRPWMCVLLLVSGIAAISIGWLAEGSSSKFLLTTGGFAFGLAAEKFAEIQKRRIQSRVLSETNAKSQKT